MRNGFRVLLGDAGELFVRRLDGHMDAVGDFEAGFLAHRLELGNDLAGKALGDQLLGQVGIQRNGHAAVSRHDITRLLHRRGQHVVLFQLDSRAVQLKAEQLALLKARDDLVAVQRGELFADRLEQLAVLLAQRAHLRLEAA